MLMPYIADRSGPRSIAKYVARHSIIELQGSGSKVAEFPFALNFLFPTCSSASSNSPFPRAPTQRSGLRVWLPLAHLASRSRVRGASEDQVDGAAVLLQVS